MSELSHDDRSAQTEHEHDEQQQLLDHGKGDPMSYEIRPATDDDLFGWLPLFAAYCEFYETSFDDAKALSVWKWLRDEHHPLRVVLAIGAEGQPVGFAHFRAVPETLSATSGVFLDDLFVTPETRGGGVGRALIEHVHDQSALLGTGGVQWITAADNAPAQRLYDSLATRTSWVTYEMHA